MSIQQLLIAVGAASSGQQYWDPTTTDTTRIALSGPGNRIATRQPFNINSWRSVLAVDSRSTGKKYFEIENTLDSGGPTMMGGVSVAGLSVTAFCGSTSTSWGFHGNATNAETYTNGVASNSGGTRVTSGTYMRIAVDFDAGKLWLGPSGSWEGGGDPATGTTPTYTITPNLVLYPGLSQFSTTQQSTLRLVAADMAGTLPSGFSTWS